MTNRLLLFLAISMISTSCGGRTDSPVQLASFTENDVDVTIYLDANTNKEYFLSATFTPPSGYHLYSKDIPLTGVDGLGRPTLLELTDDSQMRPLDELVESASAETPDFEPRELLVYPPGAVTLSLPIELPNAGKWVSDVVKITYMACNDNGCKAPVTGKLVPVRVPSATNLSN